MFKTTTIASAAALALGTLGATAHAADYKGPDLKGETITITCPWTGAEEGFFKKVVANFEKATGATVKHSCSQSSEQQIVIDIKAGSPSNISVFPQPGLAANMAAIRAVMVGWRKETGVTSGPNSMRRVWLASQVSETHSSNESRSGGLALV